MGLKDPNLGVWNVKKGSMGGKDQIHMELLKKTKPSMSLQLEDSHWVDVGEGTIQFCLAHQYNFVLHMRTMMYIYLWQWLEFNQMQEILGLYSL